MAININSQPSGIVPAGNKSIIKVGGSEYSVSGVIAADYKIVCKIYRITIVGGSPVSTLIATIEGIPSINQSYVVSTVTYYWTEFDISEFVLADFQEMALPTARLRNSLNYIQSYNCNFQEFKNGAFGSPVASNTFTFIPAGAPELRNYSIDPFSAKFTPGTNQELLNLVKNGKMIFNQPLFLNFYNTYTTGNLNLMAKVYFDLAGTSFEQEFVMTTATAPATVGLLCYNVNMAVERIEDEFWFLAFTLDNAKFGFKKLEFWMAQASGGIVRKSEILSFEVIHPEIEIDSAAFYYINSAGCWEGLFTNGKKAIKDSLQSETTELYQDNRNASTTKRIQGNLRQLNQKLRQEIEISTGFMNSESNSKFKDFLRSEVILERIGEYYFPIIITDTDFKESETDQVLLGRSFKYQYAQLEGFSL